MSDDVTAYIGIGSNLNEPERHVKKAIDVLSKLSQVKLLNISSLYTTSPVLLTSFPSSLRKRGSSDFERTLDPRFRKDDGKIEKDDGKDEHPNYINAVAEIRTSLAPNALLEALLAVETQFGRVREAGKVLPRIIDLDVLLYANEVISQPNLNIPHPRMVDRGFVLVPLFEIAPKLEFPDGKVLQLLVEEWRKHSSDNVVRIEDE